MAVKLIDKRATDGSRIFGELPQRVLWYEFADHMRALPGVDVTQVLTIIIGGWVDFTYRGHEFSVNDPLGDYWFFVKDPTCPDDILLAVLEHAALVLDPSQS
jgi:hypothetical protein